GCNRLNKKCNSDADCCANKEKCERPIGWKFMYCRPDVGP
nr:Chain B, MK1-3.6.10 [synthetic construct]